MEVEHWSRGSCDGAGRGLARLRDRASDFFESMSVAELVREVRRHLWVSDWLRIANEYRIFAETARADGLLEIAREAYLCSLTAFEVSRSLACRGDLASIDLAAKIDSITSRFEKESGGAIERVKIDCHDQEATGFFLAASRHLPPAPAVICIGDEEISFDSMLSRLLPASLRRNVSLLLIDASNSRVPRTSKPEYLLQRWLDYLEARPDVDPRRIAIYGEGAGASHASRLARSDRRIAAAVCDGGLLTSVMRRASVRWLTGFAEASHEGTATNSLLSSRRIPCPLLVVVGSRSMVLEQDALELQTGYRQAGADCSIVVPNRIPYPLGEVENFVAVDDFIFEWFDSKLGTARRLDPVVYL